VTTFYVFQETYGEDPFLTGVLAQQFVRGLQGSHPRYIRANACCKHFDAHGGPENIPVSRLSFDAKVKYGVELPLMDISARSRPL
jgi:beta-glucosidase